MVVATQPYGKADFEYPEIVLNPFRASSITVIKPGEYKKNDDEDSGKDKDKANESDFNTVETGEKTNAPIPAVVKPFPLKMEKITPKQSVPTIDVPIEKIEPKNNYAPIPSASAPVGQ